MDILHAILLGLIQGLTEFLPISSSAHLILLPVLTAWEDQGILFDIAVHAGSLGAVVLYFRKDIKNLCSGFAGTLQNKATEKDFMSWYILLATVPVVISGFFFHDVVASSLRNAQVIAISSIGFGLLLLWADRTGSKDRTENRITWKEALIIGLAQAIAIIPGTSRSGITITAGLFLGLDRQTASRFSFLLAIPVIFAAVSYELVNLSGEQLIIDWLALAIVFLVSFASAWLAIHYFLKLLNRTGMLPYVIYRILLGIALLLIY